MNYQQAVAAAHDIDTRILEPVCDSIKRDMHGRSIAHLRWMIAQIADNMPEDKAMRWLGYIQGVLVSLYTIPLADMVETNGRATHPDTGGEPDYHERHQLTEMATGRTERADWQPTHQHYKGGLYRVLLRGQIEATLEEAVVYENNMGGVWIRPAREFDEPERFRPLPSPPVNPEGTGG